MKRISAVIICICMIISAAGSAAVFAADETAGTGTAVSAAAGEQHEDESRDDTAEQIVYIDPDEITVEAKKELINSAELHPVTTGYSPLDDLVAKIHSKIFTPTMDTYDKVCAIYKYLMTGTRYEFGNPTSTNTYSELIKTHNYKNKIDYYIVYNAYGMLVENYGVCNHYSSAFMVMTRALGLESFIASCTSSTKGLGSHFSGMIRLNGRLYRFDPVMGVVTNKRDIVAESEYFCTPMVSKVTSEFSYLDEQVRCFGNFEMFGYAGSHKTGKHEGKTEGDVHFSFGSYPQTRVTDEELIERLNEQLNGVTMNYYPYTCGTDEPGSQKQCDNMSWADITYNNEKYRVVKIDEYRPKYIYRTHEKANSQQFRVGYDAGNTYWFKFEPIEWRLADGNNLLIADLVLDAQPFNESLYFNKKGKRINGRTYYVFNDEEMTRPANSWEYSSIRRWLNEDFYNTAFTAAEQRLILDSQIKNNCNYLDMYENPDTTDRVFLLSLSEIRDSQYYLASGEKERRSDCSDYAKSQGATSNRNSDDYGFSTSWLLRSPGIHSGDISVVLTTGTTQASVNAGAANAGIKPAIRIDHISSLVDDLTEAPDKPEANATDTGQITLRAHVFNGVDGYKFYVYTDDETKPDYVYTSTSPTMPINGLIPGKTYSFRSTAYRLTEGQLIESPMSETVRLTCRTLVEPPSDTSAEPVSTGTVRLSFTPVEGAVEYRVYRYIDSENLELCASSSKPVIDVTDLKVGSPYAFKLTSVSDDGYESKMLKKAVTCVCESFPKRPENFKVEPYATHKLQISWDAVRGAASYNVYRFYSADDIELIASTSDTSVIVSDLRTSLKYYYKIEAVGENGQDVSALSGRVGCTCISIPPTPVINSVEPYATYKLKVNWDAVDGAATYNVYRYFKDRGLVLLGSTDKLSYIVSDLNTGDNCYFRVEAVTEDGKDISEVSSLVGGTCESYPPVPKNVIATTSKRPLAIDLKWDPVDGATGYEIYKYNDSEKRFDLFGKSDKNSFEALGLKGGSQVRFAVAAIKAEGDVVHVSSRSNTAIAVTTNLAVPERVTAAATGSGEVTLNWAAVPYADRYDAFIYDSVDKDYKKVASSRDNKCIVRSLKTDTSYVFRVTAVCEFETHEIASGYSSGVSCKVLSGPEAVQKLSAEKLSSDTVRLSWSAVKGAVRYNIYAVSPTAGTEDELLGTTDTTGYTAADLTKGRVYRFYVKAVKPHGSSTLTGDPSDEVIVDIPAEKPYIIGDADDNGVIEIVDATFVQRSAAGIKVPMTSDTLMHADIDRDGAVGIVDATFIQCYLSLVPIPYSVGVLSK